MPLHELEGEIAAGVAFWGYEAAARSWRSWASSRWATWT